MAADSGREPSGRYSLDWLGAKVEELLKGQEELRRGQAEQRAELREETRNANKRFDKMIWVLIGAGAILGAGILGTLGGIIAVLVTS